MDSWTARDEAERAIDGPVMSLAGSSDLGRLGCKLIFELPRRRGRRLGHLVTDGGGFENFCRVLAVVGLRCCFLRPSQVWCLPTCLSEAAPRVELVIVRQMRPTQLSQLLRCNGALDHGIRSKS